jgi:branched-chain amino acid transport system permease protein
MTAVATPPNPYAAASEGPRHGAAKRPTALGLAARGLVYLAVAWVVLVFVPGTDHYVDVAAEAVIFAIVGLSLNILIGYTGQLSLGHQGFYGAGAFAAAYAGTVHHVPFALTFVVALLVGALVALLLGLVALRITGLYLALITLVFGLTLEGSLFEVPEFTNGGAGQPAERPEWLFEPNKYYFFCLAFLVVALFLDWRLVRTKAGRALLALKENERVAEAFGINVTTYKLLAFMLSGALAGVAGALFAYSIGNVTGNDYSFLLALTFVLMTVVGGLGSRVGVVLGAVLFASLDFWIKDVHWVTTVVNGVFRTPNMQQFAPQFIGALGLLLTITQYPGGIGQQISPLTRWLAGHPFSLHHDKDSGPGTVEGSSVRA